MTGFDIYIAPALNLENVDYALRIKANKVDEEKRRNIKERRDRMEALREQKEIDDMFICSANACARRIVGLTKMVSIHVL